MENIQTVPFVSKFTMEAEDNDIEKINKTIKTDVDSPKLKKFGTVDQQAVFMEKAVNLRKQFTDPEFFEPDTGCSIKKYQGIIVRETALEKFVEFLSKRRIVPSKFDTPKPKTKPNFCMVLEDQEKDHYQQTTSD